MARLGFAWELGAFSGYAALIAQIAREALRMGHECVFFVKDPATCAPHLPSSLGTLVQAPACATSSTSRVRVQTSYATLLHNCGYDDGTALAACLRAWQGLFAAFRIDRLLARHSPTAVLAGRLHGMPVLRYGSGFTCPPDASPWPSFRPDLSVAESALRHNEGRVLAAVNGALQLLGRAPLDRLSGLFGGLPTVLLGHPELDHYARREAATFVGSPSIAYGSEPQWPEGPDPAIFVSLMPGSTAQAWLQLLERLPARSLVRFPGPARSPAGRDRVRIANGAVDFSAAVRGSSAVVGYGSHNLASEALLAGKPMAVIAHNPDHLLIGLRVQQMGAGILLPERPTATTESDLRRFLDSPRFTTAAAQFAARHAGQDGSGVPAQILRQALGAGALPL